MACVVSVAAIEKVIAAVWLQVAAASCAWAVPWHPIYLFQYLLKVWGNCLMWWSRPFRSNPMGTFLLRGAKSNIVLTLQLNGHARTDALTSAECSSVWAPCWSMGNGAPRLWMCHRTPRQQVRAWFQSPTRRTELRGPSTSLGIEARFLVHDLLRASKWLTILAWHFSLRPNRRREFHWCRTCAALLRAARRCLRAADLQGF